MKLKSYRVTRTIYLSHYIDAASAKEAEAIAEDKGDINAASSATSWRASLIREKR